MNRKAGFLVFILILVLLMTSCGALSAGQNKINGTYTGVSRANGMQTYVKAILNNGNIEVHSGYLYDDDDYVAYGTYTVSGNTITVKWDVSKNIGTLKIDETNNNLITETGVILRKTT